MIKHEFIKMAREPTYSFPSFARLTAKYSIFFFTTSVFKAGHVSEEARDVFREATYKGEKYLYSALHSPCV